MSFRKRSRQSRDASREESAEYYSSDSEQSSKRSNTSLSTFNSGKDDLVNKAAIATARVMLGLSNRNQVLNKNMIAKILEAENEKGSGLQFKRFILPALSKLFNDIFYYDVVELPSKKSLQQQQQQQKQQQQQQQEQQEQEKTVKVPSSDEFVLVNNIPPPLRALNYSFMAEFTQPIGSSLKSMDKNKRDFPSTNIYGEDLPRPTSMIVQNGITLLIICIILLHGNNILQSDLISVLKKNFGLSFKEKEVVSILGNQTLNDFLTTLNKQDYIERTLITTSTTGGSHSSSAQRSINSKTTKHDDNTLMIRLGRRCMVEWSKEEVIGLFRQIMQDQWTEELMSSAIFTVSSVWN